MQSNSQENKMNKYVCILITLILISTLISCTVTDTDMVSINTNIQPVDSGTITVSPSSSKYQKDSIVNLTATPADGMVFDHWSGDTIGSDSSIYVTLVSTMTVTANFKHLFNLNITVNPSSSGSVSAQSRQYKEGDSVTITAIPVSGYKFGNWSGDIISSDITISITMDSEKVLQANFIDIPPTEVSNLVAKGEKQSIRLSWVDPVDLDLNGIVISSTDLASPVFVNKGLGNAIITGLKENRLYTFIVKSVDFAGNQSSGATISATPYSSASSDYFPINEGYGIKYHLTDDYLEQECDIWAVSQYCETEKPYEIDFVFTLIQEGKPVSHFFSSTLGGRVSHPLYDIIYTLFTQGSGSDPTSNAYLNFKLPQQFNSGDLWEIGDKTYSVEQIGAMTVGGTVFNDCIRIKIDDSYNNAGELYRGTGFFILARNVGIVQIVFNRTNGQNISYEYIECKQFAKYTVSGTIFRKLVPVEGLIVQIAYANWGTRAVTDTNGSFSISFYGPDIVFRIGYDVKNDDVLDFDVSGWPKSYILNNVSGNISGLNINL